MLVGIGSCSRRTLVVGSLSLVFSAALISPPASASDFHGKIIDGTSVSETRFPAVARLNYQGDLLCTGTLISKRHILTAAHCFFGENGSREVGNTAIVARLNGVEYKSTKVTINPAYRAGNEACVEGETDSAIIELSRDVAGVAPIPLMTSRVPVGAKVTLVGYGTLGSGSSGENGQIPPVGKVNYGTAKIDGFGNNPGQQNTKSSYYYWKFDSGESNTASGDSGGPAFYDVSGKRYISGITCGGDGNAEHGTYSYNTRADLLAAWARSITGQAAPAPAPKPNPGTPSQPAPGPRLVASDSLIQFDGQAYSDFLWVRGKVFVGNNFSPAGKNVRVTLGSSFSKTFTLAANGQSTGDQASYLDLSGSQVRGVFKNSTVQFDLNLEALDLTGLLSRLGFSESYLAEDGDQATLPIAISVNGRVLKGSVRLQYNYDSYQWEIAG